MSYFHTLQSYKPPYPLVIPLSLMLASQSALLASALISSYILTNTFLLVTCLCPSPSLIQAYWDLANAVRAQLPSEIKQDDAPHLFGPLWQFFSA